MDTATELSAAEVVERVLAARATEQAAAVEQLEMALVWARLHPCAENEVPAHWGEVDLHSEGPSPLAGPGAPLVAEFAPADLGAALGISLDAARLLLGDALELAHRLPRLWDLVRTGRVPAWRARQISRQTHDLSVEAAAFADRLIAATPDQIGRVDAARLVDEARLYFDPDRAVEDEQHALSSRGVWLRPGRSGPATTEVFMVLDTPDAELFDATVTRIAVDLRALGDTEALEVRRARAVGILADPQHALDLMSGRDGAAPSPGAGTLDLYVHLTPADLAHDIEGRTGAATIEKLGAATTDLLDTWLARHTAAGGKVVWRPVLDLAGNAAVDQHDPPPAMRDQVVLRDSHCVFPGCRRDSRSCACPEPVEGTSTTSWNTSPSTRADHQARPGQTTSRHCAAPTTASRPSPPGPTRPSTRRRETRAATPGPARPATTTPSTRPPADPHHHDEPDRPTPGHPPQAGDAGMRGHPRGLSAPR